MNAPKHTPEPWHISGQSEGGRYITISAPCGRIVARVPWNTQRQVDAGRITDAADAARIVACVNYCAGMTADQLTQDSAEIVRHELDRVTAQRDALAAALVPFANVGEYRELREGMAAVLREHERAGFLAAFDAARRALSQLDQ